MRYGSGAKRAFDLLVAVPVLVVALPVILLGIAAVKATSPGPAIFTQRRVGQGRAEFICYKLRTMRVDTPHVATHQVNSDAVTPAGHFLRRSKLDELPQLWNVVKGEMSLVGPRPCLPSQKDLIALREARGVYAARPGVTGLAQILGVDMSQPARLAEIDAEYVRSISLAGDLRILFRTVARRPD